MYKMITSMIMMASLSMIIMMVCLTISTKSTSDREKMSPFECGFDPKSSPRMPFSMQFFLIAVLFLIFDVEIVIILPMVVTMKTSSMSTWIITVSLFIIILMAGLYHEWKNGVLEWAT